MQRYRAGDAVHEIAARWLLEANEGLPPGRQRDLDAWLAADIRHRVAYIRLQTYWKDFARFAAAVLVPMDELGYVLDLSLEWPYSILFDECRTLFTNNR